MAFIYHREHIRRTLAEISDSFAIASLDEQNKAIDAFIEQDKKRRLKRERWLKAKKEGTLKPKKRTVEKIVFYIGCLIERYGNIFSEKKLFLKLSRKIENQEMIQQAIEQAKMKGVLNIQIYFKTRLMQWANRGYGKRIILQKFYQDYYSPNEEEETYIDEYLASIAGENGLNSKQEKLILKAIKQYKLESLYKKTTNGTIEDKKIYFKKKQSCLSSLNRKGISFSMMESYLKDIEN